MDGRQRRQGQRGPRPIVGATKVANGAHRPVPWRRSGSGRPVRDRAIYNSAPALVLYLGDHLEGVITVEIIDGRITHFYAMRNPDKLTGDHGPRGRSAASCLTS